MSELVCARTQEEYEDDFEKDLDWLISEEGRSESQDPDYEDIEAEIDKELEGEEEIQGKEEMKRSPREEKKGKDGDEGEERWPSPMEPLEYDSDRDSPLKSSSAAPPPPGLEDQPDEDKKYILEKIQQANRELQDQEAPDETRRRRLQFKETLVDLVVPPLSYEQDARDGTGDAGRPESGGRAGGGQGGEAEREVSGRLSELKISPREQAGGGEFQDGGSGRPAAGQAGRVLVEKDGKFDLVSLNEMENQGLLPPLPHGRVSDNNSVSHNSPSSPRPQEANLSPNKTPVSTTTSSPRPFLNSGLSNSLEPCRAPRPPSQPRNRPNSASNTLRGSQRRGTKRRVQSANGNNFQSTYTMSAQEKELLQRIQERRERLAKEKEQQKREEEEQKRRENELAFRAWLMRKKDQFQEERRIHRAQEMERMNCKPRDNSDPEEAFKSWLQRKHEQQQREKRLEEMKRLEEESGFYLHNREDCERAFKLWLKRKRAEKRAEQLAARERSRRLIFEERRSRRMQDLLCTVNEAKPFRFSDHLSNRF
ncbi:coiled-coil domain-containing protein 181 [Aplochiton taeniatus]